jgi:dihydroorotase
MKILIKNATIVNEGSSFRGSVVIENDIIANIIENICDCDNINADKIIDATNLTLIPGIIDTHVHFREPGMTHKADIHSETMAAVAGGVTSFMDMPNNIPPTTTIELLEKKYNLAKEKSIINYSFYLGATNDNIQEIKKIDASKVCGLKVFMGSSTGNMLVDNQKNLETIFAQSPVPIVTHCEDEQIIRNNILLYQQKFGDNISFAEHSKIRSEEACVKSIKHVIKLAEKHNTQLHILHISTGKEVELLAAISKNKRISAETCTHYLWFCDCDYDEKTWQIKCNPSIKTQADRTDLRQAVANGIINTVTTDHAPHLIDEKNTVYIKSPSGLPSVQHSLNVMLELVRSGIFKIETVVETMCHNPARIFSVEKRGFIRPGYKADIVLLNTNEKWNLEKPNILYKCAWSPFENITFNTKITHTFVNGKLIYHNGKIDESARGERLTFDRKQSIHES